MKRTLFEDLVVSSPAALARRAALLPVSIAAHAAALALALLVPVLRPGELPGGQIKEPRRVVYVAPVYPDLARQARVGGVVVLDCTIDRDGRMADVRVVQGHPLLNEAALSAARQWVYTPTRLNGVAVRVVMTVTIRFVPRP